MPKYDAANTYRKLFGGDMPTYSVIIPVGAPPMDPPITNGPVFVGPSSSKRNIVPVFEGPKKLQHPWTLDEALRLVRGLQPEAQKYGFHVCLGGSVLNVGVSHKDVDVYFLPLGGKDAQQIDALVTRLEGLWGKAEPIGNTGPPVPARVASDPYLSFKASMARATERMSTDQLVAALADAPYTDNGVYRKKLKFVRDDGRIDVFVV